MQQLAKDQTRNHTRSHASDQASETVEAASETGLTEVTLAYRTASSGRRPLNSFGTCSTRRPKSVLPQSVLSQHEAAIRQEAGHIAPHDEKHEAAHEAAIRPIQSAPTVRFGQMARAIGDAARSLGLRPPGFMTPPRHKTADRTITRTRGDTRSSGDDRTRAADKSDESCLVAVRVKGRPLAAIKADIIEGVIVANNLPADKAAPIRKELWRSLTTLVPDD